MKDAFITVIILLVLLTGSFFAGRWTKHCDVVVTHERELDSLHILLGRRMAQIDFQQRSVDSLRTVIALRNADVPDIQTQVDHAYSRLAVPVDSLASILLARPDTIR